MWVFKFKFWLAVGEFAVASLAYLVLLLFCLMFLLGPFAVWFAVKNWPIAAGLGAVLSIWLGIFWFAHVFTWPRYLGLISAALGAYAIWLTATRR